MPDQIRVNGNQLSWGSIRVKFNGNVYYGFKALDYGDKRERVKTYGMGAHQAPRGRTRGKYSTEPGKITGPVSTVQALCEDLAAAFNGVSFGDTEFEVIAEYFESDELPLTVQLERSVITARKASHEESAEGLFEDLEIDYMLVRRNGLTLFDGSRGTP